MLCMLLLLCAAVCHAVLCRAVPCCAVLCRLWQIVEWLAEADDGDVLIVLDECHRAKNLVATEGRSTKTGIAVLALQNALPNARCGCLLTQGDEQALGGHFVLE